MTLITVGDGPKRESLERTVADSEITEYIRFVSYFPIREDAYVFLKWADMSASRRGTRDPVTPLSRGCGVACHQWWATSPPSARWLATPAASLNRGTQRHSQIKSEHLLWNPAEAAERDETVRERAAEFPIERTAITYYEVYRSVA